METTMIKGSILDEIKKIVNVDPTVTAFDTDIIIAINSAFMLLNQLGVGPKRAFSIEDNTATWDDFLQGDYDLNGVKSYIQLNVRILFDPPTSGVLHDAMTRQIAELGWRLNVQAETPAEETYPDDSESESDEDE